MGTRPELEPWSIIASLLAGGFIASELFALVDPDGKGLHTHWQKTACALMTGCIAHVFVSSEKREGPRHVAGSG